MDKKSLVKGFLIIILIFTAMYSYAFLMSIRNRRPNRAKLVMTSEVVLNGKTGDLCSGS